MTNKKAGKLGITFIAACLCAGLAAPCSAAADPEQAVCTLTDPGAPVSPAESGKKDDIPIVIEPPIIKKDDKKPPKK